MAMTDVKYDTEQQMKIKQLYKVGSECELKLLLRLILWWVLHVSVQSVTIIWLPLQNFDWIKRGSW